MLSLVLVSCGKEYSFQEGWDTSEWYYFKEYVLEETDKPIEWAISYEVLMKENCWEREMFDSLNTKVVSSSYPCYALVWSENLYRVMVNDIGVYKYYNLIPQYDYELEKYTGNEFILSDNTF